MAIHSYDTNSCSSKRLGDIENSIVSFKKLVFCFTEAVERIKKCFNYVTIILTQNAAFDTANAGEQNVTFVFVIGTLEHEMTCCFCFQATSAKWINSVLK